MSRARSNARIKLYLAVFVVGMLASGAVLGYQLGRRLAVSADFQLNLTDEEVKQLNEQNAGQGTVDQQGNFTPTQTSGNSGSSGKTPQVPGFEVGSSEQPQTELAAVTPLPAVELENFFKADSLQEVVLKTIPNFLLAFVGLVAMAVFLVNALRYVFSAGNADATNEAKAGMLYAAIGVAVVVLAYGIINTVRQLLGS
ncbi:hypothetical protein HY374_03315 [Candidatus Berkelbacteria bacterium]|nr:hypothetical protein [Candidatus Berkelbacteria bacterium]